MADRYQIKGRIGRGGIGAIYLAYDSVLKREVAIKRLLPLEETNLNESAENTLTREAEALSRLQHPNVITLFAFEEDEEGPFVVMEYIEGDTLKDTIDNGALSYEDFQVVANQCLDPLITARELGLLHRDIKPANIMLQWLSSGSFQVKVLDFGLAKFSQAPSLQTLDQTGSFLGSIEYLAPEQLELKPLDQRTDLYSLGCVLYFCLAQRSPFEGTNPAATTTNHLNHVVSHISEVREDIPKPVADWLMLMISRYPDDRPTDAREALQLLKEAQAGKAPIIAQAAPATAIPVSAPVVAAPPVHSGPVHTAAAEISGPVAPPPSVSGPVATVAHAIPVDPPGSATKKLITGPQVPAPHTVSSPIKLITGPVPTAGAASSTNLQKSKVSKGAQTKKIGKVPVAKTPAIEKANKQNSSSIEKLKGQSPMIWVIVALVVVVIVLVGFLVSNKGKNEQGSASSADSSKVVISKPPVTKGLQLQLAAADSVLDTHSDIVVEGREQVLISSPNDKLQGFELLQEIDDKQVLITEAISSIHSELNASHPAISFKAGAAIDFNLKDDEGFFLPQTS